MSCILKIPESFDLLIYNGCLMDPANNLNGIGYIAIDKGKILFHGFGTPPGNPKNKIDAAGRIVCPGLIDMHVHVYEWMTNFGINADDVGVHAGVTTIVDQGSSGAWTFGGFKNYVIDQMKTDVRAFVSINVAGALQGGMKGDVLHSPIMTDKESLLNLISKYPNYIKGIKCHCESGGLSRWGTQVLEHASIVGKEQELPLYVHTGELFPVIEDSRPSPDKVIKSVIPLLKKGDILAHFYSSKPDGIVGYHDKIPSSIYKLRDNGVHFDIGYGINFSYRIARKLISLGMIPYTISSDVHGDFNSFHDFDKLDYSLYGAMTRLWNLGVSLEDVILSTTLNPAKILKEENEIGTLEIGSRADLSLIEIDYTPRTMVDGLGDELLVNRSLLPWVTIREGEIIVPHRYFIRDLIPSELKKEGKDK